MRTFCPCGKSFRNEEKYDRHMDGLDPFTHAKGGPRYFRSSTGELYVAGVTDGRDGPQVSLVHYKLVRSLEAPNHGN